MDIAKKILKGIFNVILVIIFTLPFYWMFLTAFKTLGQTLKIPPDFYVLDPQWVNFKTVFEKVDIIGMTKNSIIVTGGILLCQAITVIPAAYAFARYKFVGSNFLFGLTLGTMMIPAQLIFLPVFLFLSEFGLINTYASLILPSASSAFAIFMLRQTFMQIPEELVEAARLDKTSELQIMWKIMLPIARPTVMTLGLLTFISTWNDYFWPFVLTTNDAVRTLPVGIAGLKSVDGAALPYQLMMAGNVILVIPVIIAFMLAQKQIISAFTYMGEK
ncbi:MAG: sugar ABC transporter permease [Epulopiscium sp. Nele67-Bin005]|nr:MAG: sugar ABC transporter permease [Epulopiscium sp. Nele67-Bin005]